MATTASKSRRPTISDVARRAGVSTSLVSLVLQGSPLVREPKRAAVDAAIKELGYRPSRAAATLAGGRTKTVGLIIDDYRNLWFVELLQGLQSELDKHGYHVTVLDSKAGDAPGNGAIDQLLSMRVDGIVVAMDPRDSMLEATWAPTVVAGWRDRIPEGADLIANDDSAGGRLAAGHLLELGHTRIGHLTGSGGAATHRRAGFLLRCAEAGLPVRLWGEGHGTSEEDGYQAACALMDHFPDTTAIFAANDIMAVGALAALRERGLQAPRDVSVLGYDNSPLAMSRYLDLSSVDAKSGDVGAGAAQALLARMEDPARTLLRTLIPPALAPRGTTAPLGA
jgi:DNA-binding LacI/PurR family transcriptional regulator